MANSVKPPLKLGNKPMVKKPLPSAPGSHGQKHGVNLNQCAFGKGKVYSEAQRRQPKTYGNNAQQNGTNSLQYNNNNNNKQKNAIRGFDIGNNAKYDAAHEMAKHTNALPSNFWESESDTDSEEERKDTQEVIANRWKANKTNIGNNLAMPDTPSDTPEDDEVTFKPPQRMQVYDQDTSSEDDESDDGFQKYVAPPKPALNVDIDAYKKKKEEERWNNNTTTWIVEERNKRMHYETMWFKVPKLRNGKVTGQQMRPYLEQSGLSKEKLKQIWKLSDLDKDGKMGNEEFILCMFLLDEAKNGAILPTTLPLNYVPQSFRGKDLVKTPPFKKPQPKILPPNMALNHGPTANKQLPPQNTLPSMSKQVPQNKPLVNKQFPARNTPHIKPKPQANAPVNRMQTKANTYRPTNTNSSRPVASNTVQNRSKYQHTSTTNRIQKKPSSFRPAPSTTTPAKATPFGAAPRRNPPQSRPSRNNAQRGNNYQQRKVYSQNQNTGNPQQIHSVEYQVREKSIQAAKTAGVHAKKALGWMTKKMNDMNDKVQDNNNNQNNRKQAQYNQGTTYQKKY